MRAQIALLFYTTLNVAVFTVAVYIVMLWPTLNEHAGFWIAVIMAASLILTAPLAWALAPRVRPGWRKKITAVPSPLAKAPTRPI